MSTEEQAEHGYSIEVQQQVNADFAAGHELEIVKVFIELESAFKPGRPEFARMVEFLENHKAVGAVLVYKIDRISRNMSDYATLAEKMGVEVISATEQLPANATGRLMGDMQAAFSRYFSAQLSERVTDAMHAKAKQGLYPSVAPLGYLNDREKRVIVPDPEKGSLIRELFEAYANSDVALSDLVGHAKRRGLRSRNGNPLQKSTVYRILGNPIYVGMVRWGSVTAEGKHPPLVSRYLFERVQGKLNGRDGAQTRREFPFRGFLVCGYCGCRITASLVKGKYVYYHCTHGKGKCAQPYIRQEALAQRLQSVVDGVRIPKEIVVQLLEEIRRGESERAASIRARIEGFATEANELGRRRNQAYVDKLDGVLSEDCWKEMEGEWVERAQAIDEERQRLTS